MANVFVLGFDSVAEAEAFGDKIGQLVQQQLLILDDAAMVTLDAKGKPNVETGQKLVTRGALGGAFWGMLFGLIFLMPIMGLAIGAAWGALGGKLADMGMDKAFLEQVGSSIKPGEAAWFLVVRQATRDRVLEELAGTNARVIRTNLTHEQEENLRKVFADEA
jgi:uncharacterized membrane protein